MPYNKKYTFIHHRKKRMRGGVNLYAKLAKDVRRLTVQRETKFHDITTTVTPGTAATVLALCNIAQGDTNITRTGNTIYGRYLLVRWHLQSQTSVATQDYGRLLIVQDLRYNAAIPTAAQILEGSATVLDFLEKDDATRGAFKILYDVTQSIGPHNTGPPSQLLTKYVDLKNHIQMNFDGTASTNEARGCLYALFVATNNTNEVLFKIGTRVAFTDG